MKVKDVKTGEVHLVAHTKDRPKHHEPFTMLFTKPVLDLLGARTVKLTALDWRVLMFLFASCDYGNKVGFLINDVATGAGGHRGDVSKSVKQLAAWGFLCRTGGRRGAEQHYLLNPELVCRGVTTQRQGAQRTWRSLGAPRAW